MYLSQCLVQQWKDAVRSSLQHTTKQQHNKYHNFTNKIIFLRRAGEQEKQLSVFTVNECVYVGCGGGGGGGV